MKQLQIELTLKFAKLSIIVNKSRLKVLDNRVVIDLIVEKLLDAETLNGDEFRELVKKYTVLPNKNSSY
jgi:cell division protease FtsH